MKPTEADPADHDIVLAVLLGIIVALAVAAVAFFLIDVVELIRLLAHSTATEAS
jgi:hypothetical protein